MLKKRITISVVAVNGEAERIWEFKKKHKITYKDIFMAGLEQIEREGENERKR